MKIGIEAERANNPEKTGVEHYAKQLILQFARMDSENEFVLYLRTQPEEWIKDLPKNFSYKVLPFPIFWTQIRLSLELLLHPVDRLFVPASAIPLYSPKNSICTIHDAAFLFYPETFTPFMRNFLNWSYKYIGWKAKTIIVPSQATQNDLIKYYGIDERKIVVIHHGYTPQDVIPAYEPESRFRFLDVPTSRRDMTHPANVKLPEKNVLFLSTLQPRKNLEGLIQAFRLFKQHHAESNHKLVVAGSVGWKVENILQEIERNKDIVQYLNHVTDEDRAVLYKKASAFCVPSFYEGFGMWILEAFDAGVPVIASNVSSMPEVAEDAAEYFDPHSIQSIAQALE